ncbi:hypothetical protein BDN70DRAFT_902105 [Pholiota conissans]|uniref:Uncharacterized protein n=1 Tax=Pholiota conissans TaxID=109636 RepID=A0A9P6CSB8_9AGAR|nr:hypothetical protein BDN70DRAFT_902105 [Pholiota conissans]
MSQNLKQKYSVNAVNTDGTFPSGSFRSAPQLIGGFVVGTYRSVKCLANSIEVPRWGERNIVTFGFNSPQVCLSCSHRTCSDPIAASLQGNAFSENTVASTLQKMQLFNSPSPIIDGSAAPTAPAVVSPAVVALPAVADPVVASPAIADAPVARPVVAGLDVDTDVDPFILDDAMDIRPDFSSPNVSFAHVPNPADFVEPSSPETPHYCILVGHPVGVVENFDSIDITNQERFEFRHFSTWFGAFGYYTVNYHRRQVLLIPAVTAGLAPTHTRPASEVQAPPTRNAGHGSTISPRANVTAPLAAADVQSIAQGPTAAPSLTSALAAPAPVNTQSIAQGSMATPTSANTFAPVTAGGASVQPLSVSTALQAPPTQGVVPVRKIIKRGPIHRPVVFWFMVI